MRRLFAGILIGTLTFCSPLWAAETYDLIFKMGTLSDIPKNGSLLYDKDVKLLAKEEAASKQVGKVKITFEEDEMARLNFIKAGKRRNLGSFPATVGNPIIMYFVETVIRDVSQNAGGSPFYIRNRIKASLLQRAEIVSKTLPFNGKTIPVKQITLLPFKGDKNRSKMRGFQYLALTITMSEEVPGWYYSLIATTDGDDNKKPVYSSALILKPNKGQQ